ncbi:cobalt-precorrin 5A hydrolase [Neptuniibacter halophilus]|uniref:cobalt-precorrin 5A hydrolase n=1 Tax=Neptuniibacter halophilus TaxID=651666 RepID=UPI0025733DB5|nr:cobalamin biosynthesis protein [Neptuniibacter halophilus]
MIRVIALTEPGRQLAERLTGLLPAAQLCYKPQPFTGQVQAFFQAGDRLIFICATGIVMRTLAPVLEDKYRDPAVLVLDEQGRYVIPLLSGHEGGANHWALEVAQLTGGEPVITSACNYLHPRYTVGMGCERGCPLAHLEALYRDCLQQAGLQPEQVEALSSIDIKADEVGLIALAEKLGLPFKTWNAAQLNEEDARLSTRSEYVFRTVGVHGVAESAALFTARQLGGNPAELLLNKQKTARATCAIARFYPGDDGANGADPARKQN